MNTVSPTRAGNFFKFGTDFHYEWGAMWLDFSHQRSKVIMASQYRECDITGNASRDFLQIWYTCPIWLKGEVIRIRWSKVTKHIFGHQLKNWSIIMPTVHRIKLNLAFDIQKVQRFSVPLDQNILQKVSWPLFNTKLLEQWPVWRHTTAMLWF